MPEVGKESRTVADTLNDRTILMESCMEDWGGPQEYYVDYTYQDGRKAVDVPLGYCETPEDLFNAIYDEYVRSFFTSFRFWWYLD